MELEEIKEFFKTTLIKHEGTLQIKNNSETTLEMIGNKPVKYCGKMVDGYYFASIVAKPKDIRFYFFPIYTHAHAYENLSTSMRKNLKGKSCFHIKKLNAEEMLEIDSMIKIGIELYQKESWI